MRGGRSVSAALCWTGAALLSMAALASAGTWFGGLGDLTGSAVSSLATDISADNSTFVGMNYDAGRSAFRWDGSSSGGYQYLGDLAGGIYFSEADGISADGFLVYGYGTSDLGQEGFIWDSVNGMRRVADVLTAGGPDLTGWSILSGATGASADGRFLTGYGTHNGNVEACLADLDYAPVPEPGSLGPLALAAAFGLGRRRRPQAAPLA